MINNTIFYQAIDQTFPQLDQSLKQEIYDRVSNHLAVWLKEKLYAEDPAGRKTFDDEIGKIPDQKERSAEYGRRLAKKILTFPADRQKTVSDAYLTEMTRVMHQIYESIKN